MLTVAVQVGNRPTQSCPWVGSTRGLGWVGSNMTEVLYFGWVVSPKMDPRTTVDQPLPPRQTPSVVTPSSLLPCVDRLGLGERVSASFQEQFRRILSCGSKKGSYKGVFVPWKV